MPTPGGLFDTAEFHRTVQRFDAWWQREVIDRPPITFLLAPSREYDGPVSRHANLRDRWMDVEFAVDSAVASLRRYDYVADFFPMYMPNLGPELTATLYGCELEFGADTSWSKPIVHSPDDWPGVLHQPADFNNEYWQAMERMTDYAIARCDGQCAVGMTDLHGSYDILASLRDPQELCTDFVDCPQLLSAAAAHVVEGYVEALKRNYERVRSAGFGATTWCPFYHHGLAYVPSCDFWALVSQQHARELIWPHVVTEMRAMERTIFHLDGPAALRHLDLLLEDPRLDAVQWVYGEGDGPAAKWVPVYRRILAAGKGAQIICQNIADAQRVMEQLPAQGCWYMIEGNHSPADANAFLRSLRSCSR